MKTKKNNKRIIVNCLEFLNNLRLFHWNTKSYAQHISSDTLYSRLTYPIDKLVESFLQNRTSINTSLSLKTFNTKQFLGEIKRFKKFINDIDLTKEYLSLKDDIVIALDQFEYRLTLTE